MEANPTAVVSISPIPKSVVNKTGKKHKALGWCCQLCLILVQQLSETEKVWLAAYQ